MLDLSVLWTIHWRIKISPLLVWLKCTSRHLPLPLSPSPSPLLFSLTPILPVPHPISSRSHSSPRNRKSSAKVSPQIKFRQSGTQYCGSDRETIQDLAWRMGIVRNTELWLWLDRMGGRRRTDWALQRRKSIPNLTLYMRALGIRRKRVEGKGWYRWSETETRSAARDWMYILGKSLAHTIND